MPRHICPPLPPPPSAVYWPPPYGVIRHEWDTWMALAQQAQYHVAVLPFQVRRAPRPCLRPVPTPALP